MSPNSSCSESWVSKAIEEYKKWDESFYLWKTFRRHHGSRETLVESYVGLALFGCPIGKVNDTEFDISTLYDRYDQKERKHIEAIVKKFKYDRDILNLGHTYIFLENETTCCIFRQLRSDGSVNFIDVSGRVYKSWEHFYETNNLPKCKYVAPNDGVHKIKQDLRMYSSPEASLGAKLTNAGDKVAFGCTVGAIGLALTTASPLAIPLGVIGTSYAVVRNVGILVDRDKHEESIGLDNMESILAWLTIGTSAISGVSSMATSRIVKIVMESEKYSTIARAALKGINYVSLSSSVCNFATFIYVVGKKLDKGEKLTSLDLLELGVNLFLIYGAVSNAYQLHKYINSLEAKPKSVTQKLTRTAKRRLQRMRAKLRSRGEQSPNGSIVAEVSSFEEYAPYFTMLMMTNVVKSFLSKYTNIYPIYYKCLEIWQTCKDYQGDKLPLTGFLFNMANHLENLIIILRENIMQIKSLVENFMKNSFVSGVDASSSSVQEIAYVVENTITAISKVNDELLEEDNDEPNEKFSESKTKYGIILDLVAGSISEQTHDNVLATFAEKLHSTVDEIILEMNINYDEFRSKNIKILGEIKAEEMFKKSNLSSKSCFADKNFDIIMEKKLKSINSREFYDPMLEKIYSLYDTLFDKIASAVGVSKEEVGALETCEALKKSVTLLLDPLKEIFTEAKTLYEINSSYLGHFNAVTAVFNALYMEEISSWYPDDAGFFDLAMKKLNIDDIMKEFEISKSISKEIDASDLSTENKIATLLFLCDIFYQKVHLKMNVGNREKVVKHAYRYLLQAFTSEFEKMERTEIGNISELQNTNSKLCGRETTADICRIVCENDKREIFGKIVTYFKQDTVLKVLVDEFVSKNDLSTFCVNLCENDINKGDGIRMFIIDEGTYLNQRKYISKAAELLNLNESSFRLIKWESGTVILKHGSQKYVTFHNVDTRSMLLIETDVWKENQG